MTTQWRETAVVQGVRVAKTVQPGDDAARQGSQFRRWTAPPIWSEESGQHRLRGSRFVLTAELATKKSGDKFLLVLHPILRAAFE